MSTDRVPESPLVVYVTCPDKTVAESIARALVDAHEAACVNIVPGLESVYRWQGRVEIDSELLLLIKTRQACMGNLRDLVGALHPDDVPEIIAVPIVDGSPDYLAWLVDETTRQV